MASTCDKNMYLSYRQIAKWLRDSKPDIIHLFDIWHFNKCTQYYTVSIDVCLSFCFNSVLLKTYAILFSGKQKYHLNF